MNAANAADTLATSAKNAAQALGGILNLLGRGGDQGPGQAAQGAADITSFSTNISPNAPGGPGTMYGRSIGDQNPNNLINVTVNANNLIDPNQLAPIIQDTILRINRAGNQLSSTGGL